MKKDVIQSRNRKHSRRPKATNFASTKDDNGKQQNTKTGVAPETLMFQSTTLLKAPNENDSIANVSHSSYFQFTQTHAHNNCSAVNAQKPFSSFCAPPISDQILLGTSEGVRW